MKLYMSINSPYARLARVLLRETGNDSDVDEQEIDPRDSSSGYWSLNPVARIPALQLDDATVLTESLLICRYLDARLADGRFFRPLDQDPIRLAILGQAYGALDRGVAARTYQLRPEASQHSDFIDSQYAGISRSADALNECLHVPEAEPDIADLAVACLVEWVEFRHPRVEILSGRAKLAAWASEIGNRSSMTSTRPNEV